MSQMTQVEVAHFIRRFEDFSSLSNENRLLFFEQVASKICNDEWKEKFRKFLRKEKTSEYKNLINEIFDHSQIYEIDPKNVTGCHSCREAFLKLIFLST